MKGIFEDFVGIWDNNIDEYMCKEFVKYYDWTVKNNYNISALISKNKNREDESIFILPVVMPIVMEV